VQRITCQGSTAEIAALTLSPIAIPENEYTRFIRNRLTIFPTYDTPKVIKTTAPNPFTDIFLRSGAALGTRSSKSATAAVGIATKTALYINKYLPANSNAASPATTSNESSRRTRMNPSAV
jgi:hypothetical protein